VIGDTATGISAFSSLLGAGTILYVAVSNKITANRAEGDRLRLELAQAAAARTAAATIVTLKDVHQDLQANTQITQDVQLEVATTNGIKLGKMAERVEGRRIEEIPEDKRTPSEQEYVEKLIAGGRNL